jgi:nitrate reductase delta subunit
MNFSDFMRALSLLLRYPDDSYKEEIESLKGAIKDLQLCKYLKDFIDYSKGKSILDLQEYYVSTFDLTPNNSLCMLDHMRLNNHQKGYELVKIKSLYNEVNSSKKKLRSKMLCLLTNNETPDYIPLFLEYLSEIEKKDAIKLLDEYLSAFKSLYSRLIESRNPYCGLFGIFLDKEALDELL